MLEIGLLSSSTFQGSQKNKAAKLSYDNLLLEPLYSKVFWIHYENKGPDYSGARLDSFGTFSCSRWHREL